MLSKGACANTTFYDCIHSSLIAQDFDHCPRKCFSISTNGNAMPICSTAEEFECSHEVTKAVMKKTKCLPKCSQIDVSSEYEWQEDEEDPNAKRNITFSYKIFDTVKMKVEEEYLVHDFVGMLGSIGGTLGLFIGFSFLGGLTDMLSYIQTLLERLKLKQISNHLSHNVINVEPCDSHDNNEKTDMKAKVDEIEAMLLEFTDTIQKLKKGGKVNLNINLRP